MLRMTGRTVLTVEDDASIRRGIVDALTFSGYRVIEAKDGKEGLEAALHREFPMRQLEAMLGAYLRNPSPQVAGISKCWNGKRREGTGRFRREEEIVLPYDNGGVFPIEAHAGGAQTENAIGRAVGRISPAAKTG